MTTHVKQPYEFSLIRNPPDGYREWPPLTSSLQSLESSLFLIALGRYPHALVMAVTAIESALKAKFKVPQTSGIKIHALMDHAKRTDSKILRLHEQLGVGACVDNRNRIIHYGASPKDDNIAVRDYLKTAIPYLDVCYKTLFDRTMKELLVEEFGKYLSMARKLIAMAEKDDYQGNTAYCLRPLAVRLRWAMHLNFETEIDDKEAFSKAIDRVERERRAWNCCWPTGHETMVCPVCISGPAVGELDDEAYETDKTIRFTQLYCPTCGFRAGKEDAHLAELLMLEEVDSHRKEMKKYLEEG